VGKYEKMEICRKEPVMKMMVEHHFAGIPKGIFLSFFVQPFKIIWNYFKYSRVY
jgi:hypothetical protein